MTNISNSPHQKNFEPRSTNWDLFNDLREMHDKFGFTKQGMTKQQMKARLDFIQEELDEAYLALDNNDADEFVDAHIDIIVVAVGSLDLANVNGWLAWDEVHTANMAKEVGTHSKRPEMKMDLRKPEGWIKPSHMTNTGVLTQIFMRSFGYVPRTVRSGIRRRAIAFLEQAKKTMLKKADDYNAPGSRVKTADYYPRGLDDLWHMLHVKFLRITSIIDKMRDDREVQFEDLVQNLEDLAVFSAMTAEFSEGLMDGQDVTRDLFNRIPNESNNRN